MTNTTKATEYLNRGTSLAIVLVVTMGVATTSRAAITVFTDRTAWETAVGDFLTEDFNSMPDGALSLGLNNAGLIDIRVNGAVAQNQFFNGRFIGDTRSQDGVTQDLVFSTSVVAFGADWGETTTNSLLITNISGETIRFSDYLSGDGTGFLGFVSDVDFAEVTMSDEGLSGNEVYTMDNLSFSNVVPEPAAIAVWSILGMVGFLDSSGVEVQSLLSKLTN